MAGGGYGEEFSDSFDHTQNNDGKPEWHRREKQQIEVKDNLKAAGPKLQNPTLKLQGKFKIQASIGGEFKNGKLQHSNSRRRRRIGLLVEVWNLRFP
jgi:hypothetical protein